MNYIQKNLLALLVVIFGFMTCSTENTSPEVDKAAIADLLNDFLSGAADNAEIHDRFWAEDLIYTSSAGLRFGKGRIMSGFSDEETQEPDSDAPDIRYQAQDVDIRIIGDIATLAFTLVSNVTTDGETETTRFLNSGTLKKERGEWRVILWQATRMAE